MLGVRKNGIGGEMESYRFDCYLMSPLFSQIFINIISKCLFVLFSPLVGLYKSAGSGFHCNDKYPGSNNATESNKLSKRLLYWLSGTPLFLQTY
jgi:hypothetical protein